MHRGSLPNWKGRRGKRSSGGGSLKLLRMSRAVPGRRVSGKGLYKQSHFNLIHLKRLHFVTFSFNPADFDFHLPPSDRILVTPWISFHVCIGCPEQKCVAWSGSWTRPSAKTCCYRNATPTTRSAIRCRWTV